MSASDLAARAKALALEAGFDVAGVARADAAPDLSFFSEWVGRGRGGEMAYLTSQVAKRSDLRAAFPWARSILCAGLQYDTPHAYSTSTPREQGLDLALRVGRRLPRRDEGDARPRGRAPEGRGGTLRGPCLRRHRPHRREGLGRGRRPRRVGQEHVPAPPRAGSWFFLGEIVTDLDLPADAPRAPTCAAPAPPASTRVPTGALVAPYVLDATRCISYLTIEVKGGIPEAHRAGVGRHVFGCDICQDVCPWNRRRRHRGVAAFEPRPGAEAPDLGVLAGLGEEEFNDRFRRSPVKRAKRRGLLRNVAVALGNAGGRPTARSSSGWPGTATPWCASTPRGACGGSTSASVQPEALPELDLVARAGRELDLLPRVASTAAPPTAPPMRPPLAAPLPPPAIAPMIAPPAAAPPAIFASLPALEPAVTSKPRRVDAVGPPLRPHRVEGDHEARLPLDVPRAQRRDDVAVTSDPAGRSTSPSTTTSWASSATTRSSGCAVFVVRPALRAIGRAVPAATTRGRGVGVGSGVGVGVGSGATGAAATGGWATEAGSSGSGRDAVAGGGVAAVAPVASAGAARASRRGRRRGRFGGALGRRLLLAGEKAEDEHGDEGEERASSWEPPVPPL